MKNNYIIKKMKTKCNQKYLKEDDMMKIVCVISKKEIYVFCNLNKKKIL